MKPGDALDWRRVRSFPAKSFIFLPHQASGMLRHGQENSKFRLGTWTPLASNLSQHYDSESVLAASAPASLAMAWQCRVALAASNAETSGAAGGISGVAGSL